MTSLEDVVILDSNAKPESMMLFIEGDEFSEEDVDKVLEVVKNKTGVELNCLTGFKKSNKKEILSLITGK